MLDRKNSVQGKVVVTTLEALMPQEHFLRDLEKYIDFSFVYERVKHLYSSVGRPAIDPVVLVKMLLIGFLYGIDSERKIEREAQVNIAYRWFLGIDLDERIPDHSTISQTRRRKFKDSNIFEEIFFEIVKKCIDAGLVNGSLILTDSTHIKASAGADRYEVVKVEIEPREYVKKLNQICVEEDLNVRARAIAQGHKKHGRRPNTAPKTKYVRKSLTDPDSGVLNRPGKPKGFHYMSHQSVDGKSGIITDVYVAPASTDDCVPYVDRIKYQIDKYGFNIKEVGIDKGYDYVEIYKGMHDLGIKAYTALRRPTHPSGDVFSVKDFTYDDVRDKYICPCGKELEYTSIDTENYSKRYRSHKQDCQACPIKTKCLGGRLTHRILKIPFFQDIADKQRLNYGTERYYEVQRLRRTYCEGNFAIQKDNYNLRRTRKRGNKNVTEHCLLSALALNLKRLVKHLKEQPFPPRIFGGYVVFFRKLAS